MHVCAVLRAIHGVRRDSIELIRKCSELDDSVGCCCMFACLLADGWFVLSIVYNTVRYAAGRSLRVQGEERAVLARLSFCMWSAKSQVLVYVPLRDGGSGQR